VGVGCIWKSELLMLLDIGFEGVLRCCSTNFFRSSLSLSRSNCREDAFWESCKFSSCDTRTRCLSFVRILCRLELIERKLRSSFSNRMFSSFSPSICETLWEISAWKSSFSFLQVEEETMNGPNKLAELNNSVH